MADEHDTGYMAREALEWARALEFYSPLQNDIARCHELLRTVTGDDSVIIHAKEAMTAWLELRYPRLWQKPPGLLKHDVSVARTVAIHHNSWQAFVQALQVFTNAKGASKRASRLVSVRAIQAGDVMPIVEKPYAAIVLKVLPGASEEDLLEAIRANYASVVQPALYAHTPPRKQGSAPELRRQVDLYMLWIEFCERGGKGENTDDTDVRTAFFRALTREHDGIDTSHIWPSPPYKRRPERRTVEDMFENARAWLGIELSLSPLADFVRDFGGGIPGRPAKG